VNFQSAIFNLQFSILNPQLPVGKYGRQPPRPQLKTENCQLRIGNWRRGFSLLEAVLSTVILSVILAALVSVMLLASRALSAIAGTTVAEAGEAADQLTTDLSLAQAFSQREPNSVTFTVPDRTGDGQGETIRYWWSGVAGQPLMRQVNGGQASAVAGNVHHFNLSYLSRTVRGTGGGGGGGDGGSQGDEVLLMEHDDAPGGSLSAYSVEMLRWCAQYFKPTLPQGATSWQVTRVSFRARKDSNPHGTLVVQLREATPAGLPGIQIVAWGEVSEQSLPAQFQWITVNLSGADNLQPDKGYCLVLKYGAGNAPVGEVEYESNGSPMTPNTHFVTTSSAGLVWSSPNSTQDLRFRVYGTVSEP